MKGFALPDAGPHGVPIDPGPPPRLGDPATDQAFKDAGRRGHPRQQPARRGERRHDRHLARRARRQPARHERRRRAPGQPGDGQALRAERGQAGRLRPRPDRVLGRRAEVRDATRALERRSPTTVSDELGAGPAHRRRPGRRVDRLEWDVKLYLALNGAIHDAAIAAWGLKGRYDSVRPISMIRYMGGLGQSSDPAQPSYHARGLPLVPDLVEVDHRRTPAAPGQRHAAAAPATRADRHPRLARATRPIPRRRRAARLDPGGRVGAVPAAHLRHAGVRRATCPATARSAARPPRC